VSRVCIAAYLELQENSAAAAAAACECEEAGEEMRSVRLSNGQRSARATDTGGAESSCGSLTADVAAHNG